MGKILAIVGLILFVWMAIPHVKNREWLAPTPISPNSWVVTYDTTGYAAAAAEPSTGYGWFRFDFWNNPPPGGRVVTKRDTRIFR